MPTALPFVARSAPTPVPGPAGPSPSRPFDEGQALVLRQKILDRCGPSLRGASVGLQAANHLVVRLTVASVAEADRLAGTILGMPELSSYRVDLQVSVAR